MGNQCPKTHHKTSDPKIFISQIPVFNLSGPALHVTPRMWDNPSWTTVPKTDHKTSDPKIFISHIPVLNFAGAALHIIPRMCANLEPMSQDTPQNLRPQDFHLTHPCFELCRSRSPYYTPHVCQPWTNVPRHTTKPQTPRFSSHTSLFWTLPEQISILYPTCVPTHPEPMSQDTPQNLRPQDFHLTHPCFELCRSSSPYYTPHVCQPWTNVPRHTTKPQTQDFHLTHPCFELCRSRSPYYTPHVCQPILNQCPKTHHKTSDPKIFISQIPVLNFAGADLHIIPRMCANPSWTNVPRHTTKPSDPRFSSHTSLFWTLPEQISILYPRCVPTHPEPMSQDTPQNLRPQDFHLTHPCFELCRNRSPYYTPHVCQPILNQCPKTDHKTSDPKIFISHIPVLNFAGADLHIIPHPEPMSQDTPQNLRPQDFHLTHPCFELCRSRSPYYTPHVCQPILNQCPKTHHKTSDPKIFISHIPVLNFARTDVGFELRGAPNWSRDSSWTWSLGWKMWKGFEKETRVMRTSTHRI